MPSADLRRVRLVRMAALSSRTGVPVPTIKYYLREGLLPVGRGEVRNQAQYDEWHVRRIRLIRALTDIGGYPVAATKELLDRMDLPEKTLDHVLGDVHRVTVQQVERHVNAHHLERARGTVDALLERVGWSDGRRSAAWQVLVETIGTLYQLGQDDIVALLDTYADAAERVAEQEIRVIRDRQDVDSSAEGVVIGAVLGDVLLGALRRLAEQQVYAQMFAGSQES